MLLRFFLISNCLFMLDFLWWIKNEMNYHALYSRAKFAYGVLSGKYSAVPEKETQETSEQQADQVHVYICTYCATVIKS